MASCIKQSYKHCVGEDPLQYITVGLLLEKTCLKFGQRLALVSCHQNISLTFAEVLEKADKLAAGFNKLNLKKGDRIGIWGPNSTEWYIAKLACARGGYIAVGINPAAEPPEVKYLINKVEIKALVCANKYKTHDYYEKLLTIEPLLAQFSPGHLRSKIIPSLKHVIMIDKMQKR